MAYVAKILGVGNIENGRVEVVVNFYSDVETERPFTKTFSYSADSAPKNKAEAMQVIREFKRQLNDLVGVAGNLKSEIDKEIV